MVFDEGGDEEIAVVITIAQPQIQRDARPLARFPQQLRFELALQKLIAGSLVDENGWPGPTVVFDERRRVAFAPSSAISSKIAGQRFLPPRTTHRRCNRSKGRYRFVVARILERNRQRAMTAHRMTEDARA